MNNAFKMMMIIMKLIITLTMTLISCDNYDVIRMVIINISFSSKQQNHDKDELKKIEV